MKGFVLAFALLAITACAVAKPEPPPDMKGFFEECKTEMGISGPPPRPDDDDQKARCFHACVMKKTGKIVDGKLVLEKELEMASKMPDFNEEKKAKVTECINKGNAESDECEVAHALQQCLKDNNLVPPHPPHPPMH